MQDAILRWRKQLRKRWRRTQKSTQKFVKTHLKDRSLRTIERFVFVWVGVFALVVGLLVYQLSQLGGYYLADGPAPGGHYIEGMVGSVDGVNPLFAEGSISEAASTMIFSSLLRPDGGGDMKLDLARNYEISEDETIYTIDVRDDAFWHDGHQVTAEDVVFTLDTIQNPDVGSHLQMQWRDIEVEMIDEFRIELELPNPYAPFLSQLDFGILPQHLLKDTNPERMRVASFNQQPVGSGPFVFDQITSDMQLRLQANDEYYGQRPQLDRFTFVAYESEQAMLEAYNRNELRGMAYMGSLEPETFEDAGRYEATRIEAGGQVFAFFNNERLAERELRQALTQALDTRELRRGLGTQYAVADSPLLPHHLGYQPSQLEHDEEAARERFESAGLEYQDGSLYGEDGERFSLQVVTQDNFNYPAAALAIQDQWERVGVEVGVASVSGAELQEDYLRPRNFDVLLFGIGLDSDPDVYAYWHSSQVQDPGRNVSQYSSDRADVNLEDGRTRTDEDVRAAKYEVFQEEWRRDAPAVPLYRMHAYYIHHHDLKGIDVGQIMSPVERFHNVEEWTIRTSPVFKRLQH